MRLPLQTLQFNIVAQSTSAASASIFVMFLRLGVVLVVAAVLVFILALLRRGMKHEEFSKARDFSLGDLRELHREGKLSADEFERAKARMVTDTRAALLKEKKPGLQEKPFQEELKDA